MSALITDDLVEKVARTLCDAHWRSIEDTNNRRDSEDDEWRTFEPDALAALAVAVPYVAMKCHEALISEARFKREVAAQDGMTANVRWALQTTASGIETAANDMLRSLTQDPTP